MSIETLFVAGPSQYTPTFLAGSFGLTLKQAKAILAIADGDRTKAAELARIEKYDLRHELPLGGS